MNEGLGSVLVLGAGPVAVAVARELRASGHDELALWARRTDAAQAAGAKAGVPSYSERWPACLYAADTLVLAVRDDAPSSLARELAVAGVLRPSMCLLHCAGSISGKAAFANLDVAGVGLCHPLRAIATDMPGDFGETTFGIEGDDVGRATAARLAKRLGGAVLALEAEQVSAYHAAAAVASNYLVAVMDLAQSVLSSAGLDEAAARDAFASLAAGALANVRERGLPDALTGPIRRGDAQTVAGHVDALSRGPAEDLEAYRVLGRRCVALSTSCGDAEADKLAEIVELLEPTSGGDPANS